MQGQGTRMLRVKDVAARYDVSKATIYRAIESGQLDALKLGTGKGTLRIPEYALRAYEEDCGQAVYESCVLGGASAAVEDGELSSAQAQGRACVVCETDFLASGISHVPVASGSGSALFVCVGACERTVGVELVGEVSR